MNWIDTEDRLPPLGRRVLVLVRSNVTRIGAEFNEHICRLATWPTKGPLSWVSEDRQEFNITSEGMWWTDFPPHPSNAFKEPRS